MTNLLYKDLNLSIHKFYSILMPLLSGALLLIPNWPFFIAFMYIFFVSFPNLFSAFNTQKDNEFSIMLPVRKEDMVKARILSFIIIEAAHLAVGALFALLRLVIYGRSNFMMDVNLAFFGFVLVMFGLFNVVFFPLYYRSGYAYGLPVIFAVAVVVLYAAGIESLLFVSIPFKRLMEGFGSTDRMVQLAVLGGGALLFALMNLIAVRRSIRNFDKVDL